MSPSGIPQEKKQPKEISLLALSQTCGSTLLLLNTKTQHTWTVQNLNVQSDQCRNEASSLICTVRTDEQSEGKVGVCAP